MRKRTGVCQEYELQRPRRVGMIQREDFLFETTIDMRRAQLTFTLTVRH